MTDIENQYQVFCFNREAEKFWLDNDNGSQLHQLGVVSMVRSMMKGPWLISYECNDDKVIILIYASKSFENRGWSCESEGAGNDNKQRGKKWIHDENENQFH